MVHIEEVVEVGIAARRPAVRVGLGVKREVDAGESAGGLAAEETGVDFPKRNVSVGVFKSEQSPWTGPQCVLWPFPM